MPDDLRDRLEEKYGARGREPERETSKTGPAKEPGFFVQIAEFFRAKPMAFSGGLLAAAACVALVVTALQHDDMGRNDRMRGDGDGPSNGIDQTVKVYIVSSEGADALLAELNRPDDVTVVETADGLPDSGKLVVADLIQGKLLVIDNGKQKDERTIGNDPRDIALELNDALRSLSASKDE